MTACSIPVRSSWLIVGMTAALCLFAAQAAPQIANFPAATAPAGGYRIAGTVVSKSDSRPLARARITVTDVKDSHKFQSIITSEDGKYEFSGLPAGKYSLTGAKHGFVSARYDQHDQYSTAIVTGAGLETESLVLRLAPDAVITGKVLDEAGEPVRHATVTLYHDDHSSGVDQIRQYRSAQTDDLGEYEMTPLQPGTYFLSASGTPWYAVHPPSKSAPSDPANSESEGQAESPPTADRSLDVAYPVTYYPDETEAASAMPIAIRGGELVQADIHFNPVPSLRLLFRVPDAGNNRFFIPQLQQLAFDGYTQVQTNFTSGASPGLFEVTGIPAGRYNIRLFGPGQGLQMTGVDLTKDGEEVDTSKAGAVGSVKFSVQIPGEPASPPHLTVGLRSGSRMIAASQSVDSKGEAELPQVAAGRYEVAVWGGGKPYSIARISAEGAEVSGHALTLAAGSSPSVSLTLVGGSSEIQGTVTRAGKGFAGAMVVLVPKNPELDRDLFRRDQSDLDGTFALHGVVPGSYTLLAIENGWDLDWSQPTVITAYLKRGKKIEVGNQEARPMNVADPVEVQSK
ncbi:MAG: carboxypeptidase-like regulatory domain-containing protein [Candidatus Sulfotelmatobacter sp.]